MSDDLRGGLRVSQVSIIWTVVTSSAAITLGITTPSLVLVAFGLTGLLDAAGSIALVVHFRHALRHDVVSAKHERVALQIVAVPSPKVATQLDSGLIGGDCHRASPK